MKIKEIIDKIEKVAPLQISYDVIKRGGYDNSGLLAGSSQKDYSGAVITIDVTMHSVEMALQTGANLIISHHPFIYGGISNVADNTFKGKIIKALIKNDITVYSTHLCMDMCSDGIDDKVANLCGITIKDAFECYENSSYGKVGDVDSSLLKDYADKLKQTFSVVRYPLDMASKSISKVASFCGAGLDNGGVEFCKLQNVDAVISCDIAHHLITELICSDIAVIELAHGESELKAFIIIMKKILNEIQNVTYFEQDYRLN